jgi:hypothetical protein
MMKRILIILLVVVFARSILKSQNTAECLKTVDLTVQAINQKKSELIIPFLASDFTISGQKGDIAKLILRQLFAQLNDSVIEFNKVSELKSDSVVLIYDFVYKKLGKKTATFIFNKDSKLKYLELFKMQVKSMKGDAKVKKNDSNITEIPFKLVGQLITVEAFLNNEKRTFILDNGAPKLILNKKYFKHSEELEQKIEITNSKGVNGSISGMDIEKIKQFDFYGIQMMNEDVITTDISHLESESKSEIYGLIGYEVYKDYDLFFDYSASKIILLKPDFTSHYLDSVFNKSKINAVPLEMHGHIATLNCKVADKIYNFGIDCGAEANLIDDDLYLQFSKDVKNTKQDTLRGADKEIKMVRSGFLDKIKIGSSTFKKTKFVFNSMDHLNSAYKAKMDGLIGYEILSRQKTILSYCNKQLYFIQ